MHLWFGLTLCDTEFVWNVVLRNVHVVPTSMQLPSLLADVTAPFSDVLSRQLINVQLFTAALYTHLSYMLYIEIGMHIENNEACIMI